MLSEAKRKTLRLMLSISVPGVIVLAAFGLIRGVSDPWGRYALVMIIPVVLGNLANAALVFFIPDDQIGKRRQPTPEMAKRQNILLFVILAFGALFFLFILSVWARQHGYM